ncbi:hypothetical protein KKE06_01625 [Candidatus Micrarchaeota archaeon]|nr:hypothetical protein [Candidatus Micrarchaeota archaeon]MBU1930891.1 hypothetical protein [Candidatus Micrarchaeota archaeon]
MARNWKFSSKRRGLEVLRKAVRGTSGTVIPFKTIGSGTGRIPTLPRKGHTLLVRSDQADSAQKVSHAERSSQPRQHFPNTPEGRKQAKAFIKSILRRHGIIIHDLSQPRQNAQLHGRLFIRPDGQVWVYLAPPSPQTTFARWKHELVQKFNVNQFEPPKKKGKVSTRLLTICQKIAQNIHRIAQQNGVDEIMRAAFVIYKNKPLQPEFYDLLFIHGLQKPTSQIF